LALPFFSGGPYNGGGLSTMSRKKSATAAMAPNIMIPMVPKIHGMISLVCAVKDERPLSITNLERACSGNSGHCETE